MKIFNYNGKKLCDYIVYTNEQNKHIAIFRDANNKIQEVEISDIIKDALILEKRKEKRQQNEFDRHIEHSIIYENNLPSRVMDKPISLEDEIIKKVLIDEIKKELNKLPAIQRERIKKYFFENKTYAEIAREEGVNKTSIMRAIDNGLEKILKKIKK